MMVKMLISGIIEEVGKLGYVEEVKAELCGDAIKVTWKFKGYDMKRVVLFSEVTKLIKGKAHIYDLIEEAKSEIKTQCMYFAVDQLEWKKEVKKENEA